MDYKCIEVCLSSSRAVIAMESACYYQGIIKTEPDDVNSELKAFLDYVAGKEPEDDFVQRLEEAVKQARKNKEWRHEYMTLFMRDQKSKQTLYDKFKQYCPLIYTKNR